MAKKYLIGIDEAGRGPLAGPVTVGAVAVPIRSRQKFLKGIKDSKQLSRNLRETWAKHIYSESSAKTAVSSVGSKTIDKAGITKALRLAVASSLKKLAKITRPGSEFKILLDGSLYAPQTYVDQKTVIKGDENIPIIAAASIIAKVKRDRVMGALHVQFPQYGFNIHKGYGTKAHKAAIKQYGFSPVHRKSFRV